ncbi:penicillin acylase family protein [Enterovirga rhinocerotis]|uniref:Penicillin amidase n=1 Tax=Enterovirga rhinocerotis TaxID=1339210 RepID=A0A4R7C5U6_9HYPH|nr:penicillin acylase family protein [Enterovirga rhinocerotis]TDR93591.1 penicillin amidase [Enterovirga rhinocerotis]
MTTSTIDTTTHSVSGLEAEAEIVIDRWGVPHIRTGGRRDLFFVQGFNAARDRLWQIDIWRKRGLGLLSADFGPGYLAQDRAARLFLYRGDMEAEWAAYGVPDLKMVVSAFVEGVNAFIDLVDAETELLPTEFAATGTRPARWQPEDVVRIRSHALVANALSEGWRSQVLAKADLATDLARRSMDPPHDIRLPEGFDPSDLPAGTLDVLQLATAPVSFQPERLRATLAEAPVWSRVNALGEVDKAVVTDGSNNWAVAPSRTGTGRALLASDPHRAYALPSLRYVVHLSAPGFDAIGTGEPALPGISFGHNGHAAFAMTIFPADQEDLYVYETDPADPSRYRYGEGWEDMRIVTETIPVKGSPDQEVSLAFTRHGPVIAADATRGRAVAVRTVWMEPGTAAYLASVGGMEAKTPEAYAEALRHWGAPGANHVYADADGRIGWFVACKVPKRPNFDGLLPVPGDGRYEWDGFTDPSDLPRSVDPDRGWVATANENNIPAGYPNEETKLGFEFMEPSRAQRIAEAMAKGAPHDREAAMALQTDDLSLPARRLLALLPEGIGPAAEIFSGWDGSLHEDSAAAALFEVWWTHHLKPALLLKAAKGDKALAALLAPGDHETLLAALEAPGSVPWLADASERNASLAETLSAAVADCAKRLGEDPAGWAWGRLHHGLFEHPLGRAFPDAGLRDVGPLPKGGSGSTVMNTRYRPSDFRAVVGASFRTVIDVGNWDESRFINTPGQSGDPRSPHYDDLAATWAGRGYHPLVYSREAIEAAAERRIVLTPAR